MKILIKLFAVGAFIVLTIKFGLTFGINMAVLMTAAYWLCKLIVKITPIGSILNRMSPQSKWIIGGVTGFALATHFWGLSMAVGIVIDLWLLSKLLKWMGSPIGLAFWQGVSLHNLITRTRRR